MATMSRMHDVRRGEVINETTVKVCVGWPFESRMSCALCVTVHPSIINRSCCLMLFSVRASQSTP